MSEQEYRSHPGVSVSEIKTLAYGIPAAARFYREEKKEPTPAMIFGTLCHLAILEPARFNDSHYVAPSDFDGRTKEGKAWKEAHSDKPVLKATGDLSRDTIDGMMASVAAMRECANIFKWRGNNEVSIFTEHKPTGLQLKGRCDRMSEDDDGKPVIVDLKTTDDPASFERTAASLRYYLQDAFYTMLMQAHGIDPMFVFVVAGTSAPYPVRAGVLDHDATRKGANEVERLLDLYAKCKASDEWPAYRVDEEGRRKGIETFMLPRWIYTNTDT